MRSLEAIVQSGASLLAAAAAASARCEWQKRRQKGRFISSSFALSRTHKADKKQKHLLHLDGKSGGSYSNQHATLPCYCRLSPTLSVAQTASLGATALGSVAT